MTVQQKRRRLTQLFAAGTLAAGCSIAALGIAGSNSKVEPRDMMSSIEPETREAIQSANHLSTAFRAVSDHLLPSLVSIENRPMMAQATTHKNTPSADPFNGQNPFKGTPFEDMMREFRFDGNPNMKPMPREFGQRSPRPGGIGSGVIIDADGIILTNNHVVAGGGEVAIKLHDGREYIASQVWTDPQTDLAVVKIDDATDLVPAKLGDSEEVAIGDWVVALGQPFGLKSTVTAGIISAKNRGIGITPRENFLQTDAAINPGNSGGPLVNLAGEVVGINTAISSRGGGNDGIGFAVPSNLARWVSDQLIANGKVQRAYLGIGIQPVTQDLADELKVKPEAGVLVTDVFEDTPANEMGLRSGDVIVSFNGKRVKTPQSLQLAVERTPVGAKAEVVVMRDGSETTLSYVGTAAKEGFGAKPSKDQKPAASESRWGLGVQDLSSDVAKSLEIDVEDGVLITDVQSDSPADRAGLEPGMVITEVDRTKVDSRSAFVDAMKSGAESDNRVLLLVRSAKGSRFVVLKR